MAKTQNFSDPAWDSDSDAEDPIKSNASVVSLNVTKSAGKKDKKQKSSKAAPTKSTKNMSSVIYLGHIPDHFEESEITAFLSQFGNVDRMKLSRAKKSGRSKGYCFVDLSDNDTAKVVADFLNGYFLMDRRLVCNVLEVKDVHVDMFSGSKWNNARGNKEKAVEEVNKRKTESQIKKLGKKQAKRIAGKKEKLAAMGFDYLDSSEGEEVAEEVAEVEKKSVGGRKRKGSVTEEEEEKAPTKKGKKSTYASDKAVKEKAASTKAASTKAASTKAASTKAASTKAASTKAASTKAASTKGTSTKAASTKAASTKAASKKATSTPVKKTSTPAKKKKEAPAATNTPVRRSTRTKK